MKKSTLTAALLAALALLAGAEAFKATVSLEPGQKKCFGED